MMKKKNIKMYDFAFVSIIALVMFLYFYRLYFDTDYLDIYDHAQFAHGMKRSVLGLIDGSSRNFPIQLSYPVWHIVYNIFFFITHNDKITSGMTNSLFLTLEAIILLWGFRKNDITIKKSYFYTLITIFVGPLFCSIVNTEYYIGQLTANVWHNPTIICVKPVLLYVVFITIDIIKKCDVLRIKQFVLLSLMMAFSCLCKPSMMQVYIPTLIIFCIMKMVITRGEFLKCSSALILSCIPSGVVMIVQYLIFYMRILNSDSKADSTIPKEIVIVALLIMILFLVLQISALQGKLKRTVIVFDVVCLILLIVGIVVYLCRTSSIKIGTETLENGIGFSFLLVWKELTKSVLGSLILSTAFPLYILFIGGRKEIKEDKALFAIASALSGIGSFACLYNIQGTFQADFAWGAYLSIAILFVIAVIKMETCENRVKYLIGQTVLILHFLCGFLYWINVFVFRGYNGGLFRLLNK